MPVHFHPRRLSATALILGALIAGATACKDDVTPRPDQGQQQSAPAPQGENSPTDDNGTPNDKSDQGPASYSDTQSLASAAGCASIDYDDLNVDTLNTNGTHWSSWGFCSGIDTGRPSLVLYAASSPDNMAVDMAKLAEISTYSGDTQAASKTVMLVGDTWAIQVGDEKDDLATTKSEAARLQGNAGGEVKMLSDF